MTPPSPLTPTSGLPLQQDTGSFAFLLRVCGCAGQDGSVWTEGWPRHPELRLRERAGEEAPGLLPGVAEFPPAPGRVRTLLCEAWKPQQVRTGPGHRTAHIKGGPQACLLEGLHPC